jgi:hypothetical protein
MVNGKHLTEIFDFSPYNLEEYGVILGIPVYSNSRITNSFLEILSKNKLSKPIINKLKEGIESKVIIIGYEESGKLKFILDRIKERVAPPDMYRYGYYSLDDKKIVLLLDKNTTFFGNVLFDIVKTLIHEIIHMAAYENYSEYINNVMTTYLLPYYQYICSEVSNTDIKKDKILMNRILHLYKIQKTKRYKTVIIRLTYAKKSWENYFRTLGFSVNDSVRFSEMLSLPYLRRFLEDEHYLNPEFDDDYKNVTEIYFNAYKKTGVGRYFDKESLFGQEVMFPDEVVCISNFYRLDRSLVPVINHIQFRKILF